MFASFVATVLRNVCGVIFLNPMASRAICYCFR